MLFMTRKRFEEEVQKRIWEEEDRRETNRRINHVSERMYDLERKVRELESLLLLNGPVKENTCDDEFFREVPMTCGPGPKQD